MENFIEYLYHDLSKSRILPHINELEKFAFFGDGLINFDLNQLDSGYVEKFVQAKTRDFAQRLIDFSIRSMEFQPDVTVFKFCFNYSGKMYLEYDINKYRYRFIEEILKKHPTWEATMNADHKIDLIVDVDIPIADTVSFNQYLIPILREMNENLAKAPTTFFKVYVDHLKAEPDHIVYFN